MKAVPDDMHEPTPSITPSSPVDPGTGIIPVCPACGYDLRGATGDRCSECGLILDRAAFDHSGFPWAYRATRGRLRAFLATVWLVTLDHKLLRFEASRRQSPGDAAVFRRWVVALVATCLAALALLLYLGKAVDPMLAKKDSGFATAASFKGWEADLTVPWSAGVTLPGAPFAFSLIAAAYVVTTPASVFRSRGMPDDRADAVRALGRYVVAPLVWFVPAMAVFVFTYVAATREDSGFVRTPAFNVLTVAWCLLAFIAVAATVHRVGQWRARSVHGGYPTGFLAMGELLLRWYVGLALVFYVVPWCVGFVWLVVDSFLG